MKNEELKVLWKVARPVWIGATLLWVVKTAIFVIIEGWHLKATHPIEKLIDELVSEIYTFSFGLIVLICANYILYLNKKPS